MIDRRTFLKTALAATGAGALSVGLPAALIAAARVAQEEQVTALAYQGTSITVGPTVSLRTLSAAWAQEFATDEWQFPAFNFARSGTCSWNALARI